MSLWIELDLTESGKWTHVQLCRTRWTEHAVPRCYSSTPVTDYVVCPLLRAQRPTRKRATPMALFGSDFNPHTHPIRKENLRESPPAESPYLHTHGNPHVNSHKQDPPADGLSPPSSIIFLRTHADWAADVFRCRTDRLLATASRNLQRTLTHCSNKLSLLSVQESGILTDWDSTGTEKPFNESTLVYTRILAVLGNRGTTAFYASPRWDLRPAHRRTGRL